MSSWLFQFNPDQFDGDGYLNAIGDTFAWRVSRYRRQVTLGNQVFIWKAMGQHGAPHLSGVMAEAAIISEVGHEEIDPQAQPFIRSPEFPTAQPQLRLRLIRRVTPPLIAITREAALQDEMLQGMSILANPLPTNHILTHTQAERMSELWR